MARTLVTNLGPFRALFLPVVHMRGERAEDGEPREPPVIFLSERAFAPPYIHKMTLACHANRRMILLRWTRAALVKMAKIRRPYHAVYIVVT